jgi:hypothetical protein
MKTTCIMAALALFAAGEALAQQTDTDAAQQEKKICKTEPITGSRTRVRKTCMTAAQWRLLASRTRDGIEDAAKQANTFSGDSNIAYTPSGDPAFSAASR